jgi:hypothetical protein
VLAKSVLLNHPLHNSAFLCHLPSCPQFYPFDERVLKSNSQVISLRRLAPPSDLSRNIIAMDLAKIAFAENAYRMPVSSLIWSYFFPPARRPNVKVCTAVAGRIMHFCCCWLMLYFSISLLISYLKPRHVITLPTQNAVRAMTVDADMKALQQQLRTANTNPGLICGLMRFCLCV